MARCNCLVKKVNHGTDVFTHEYTELPASSFIINDLKHVGTKLTILTGGKNNHKITIAETGQLAVGIHPLDCKYTFLSFPKMLNALTTCTGSEKEGTGVKWAGHYLVICIIYILLIIIMLSDIHNLLLF